MKEYTVTFQLSNGEEHKLEFLDNTNNEAARKVNARFWINDYVKDKFEEQMRYNIISIKEK